ncbi:MAG: carboxylesterase/lipase family protein [Promethearchaeota archaeon]
MKTTEIINTTTGRLKGCIENGIFVFKAIPYAEPPIGNLRLSAPVAKSPWDGVFEALQFGPEFVQPYNINTPQPRPPQSEEDSLTLNIWTPGIDNKRRPVMFWIHGGAFIYGSGTRAIYHGMNLTKRGDVVLVTINYRLGAFANLMIPGATPNIGMLDQITALEWVRDNIEHFGGDPNNVTIFGESAGGASVCTLMAMPKAKGLFHRAISQSGAAHPLGFIKSSLKYTTELTMKELNIKSDSIDEFRKVPALDIVKTTFRLEKRAFQQGFRLSYGPYIDGEYLPQHPLTALKEGYAKDIELIVGSNFEETKFGFMTNPNFKETTPEHLPKRLKRALAATVEKEYDLDKIINIYKNSREENNLSSKPQDILDAFGTDNQFRIPAIKFAEYQSKHQKNTYMYLFSWQLPNKFGAMHGLEIGFVFNRFFNVDIPTLPKKSEETEKLSLNMVDSWVSFARSGNPNHEGIPYWPSYDIKNRSTIVFDKDIKIWNDPLEKERELWYGMNTWSRY